MSNIFNKIKNMFTGDDEYDDYYEDMEEYEESPEPKQSNVTAFSSYTKRGTNVMNISTSVQMGVCMFNPTSLEEAAEACAEIKDKNIVVVNLENVDYEISQRISDFLCGASYALEGNIQLISDKIMIIAPINVEMSGELKDKLQQSGIKIPGSIWR